MGADRDGSGSLLRAGVGRGSARGAAAERSERCSAGLLRSLRDALRDGAPPAPPTALPPPIISFFLSFLMLKLHFMNLCALNSRLFQLHRLPCRVTVLLTAAEGSGLFMAPQFMALLNLSINEPSV